MNLPLVLLGESLLIALTRGGCQRSGRGQICAGTPGRADQPHGTPYALKWVCWRRSTYNTKIILWRLKNPMRVERSPAIRRVNARLNYTAERPELVEFEA